MIVLAAVRLMPRPPALVDRRKMKISGSLLNLSINCSLKRELVKVLNMLEVLKYMQQGKLVKHSNIYQTSKHLSKTIAKNIKKKLSTQFIYILVKTC